MYKARVEARDGKEASDYRTRIAPWRTKLTESMVMGSRIWTASCSPVPGGAERESGATADLGVIALVQMLYDPRRLTGILE